MTKHFGPARTAPTGPDQEPKPSELKMVYVGEGAPWAGWYPVKALPASAPELLEAEASARRRPGDVIHVYGPEASHPYKNRSSLRLPVGRVYVVEAEVLARLSSISDDVKAETYAAAKRTHAELIFGLRAVAQLSTPRTRTVDVRRDETDHAAVRRGWADGAEQQEVRGCFDDVETEHAEPGTTSALDATLKLRVACTVVDSVASTPSYQTSLRVVRAALASDRPLVANYDIEKIAPSQCLKWPKGVGLRLHHPQFGLDSIGERVQPKVPAAIPQIRDFGDVEDQIGSGDPSDAHSAFGDDPAPTSTGQRSIVGAETTVTSDKTPRRAGPVVCDMADTAGCSVSDLPGHHRAPKLSDEPAGPFEEPLEEGRDDIAKRAAKALLELGCADANAWLRQARDAIDKRAVEELRRLGCEDAEAVIQQEEERHRKASGKPQTTKMRPLPLRLHPELERALASVFDAANRQEINRLFRKWRSETKGRPAHFTELLAKYQKLPHRGAFDPQAERRGLEAQSWIVNPGWTPSLRRRARPSSAGSGPGSLGSPKTIRP